MPVTCKLIDGKWRVVDPEGKTHGGSHATQSDCMAQARAINANTVKAHALSAGHTDWQKASGATTYRKEVLRVGDFAKVDEITGEVEWALSVDGAELARLKRTYDEMRADGIGVPVPKEHSFDPDDKRGDITGAEVGKNKDGLDALFLTFEFPSEEAAQEAIKHDVSVYMPPSYCNGDMSDGAKVYHRPVRHVALTDYPVVPKLGEWETIAASAVPLKDTKEYDMPLAGLAKKLGVAHDDGASDDVISDAIVNAFNARLTAKQIAEAAGVPVAASASDVINNVKAAIAKAKERQTDPAPTILPTHVDMMKEHRDSQIDALVGTHISPVVASALKEVYCSDERLRYCLSDTQTSDRDQFKKVVEALKQNDPLVLREQTRAQGVVLAGGAVHDTEKNPLLRDAAKRAEAAKN